MSEPEQLLYPTAPLARPVYLVSQVSGIVFYHQVMPKRNKGVVLEFQNVGEMISESQRGSPFRRSIIHERVVNVKENVRRISAAAAAPSLRRAYAVIGLILP